MKFPEVIFRFCMMLLVISLGCGCKKKAESPDVDVLYFGMLAEFMADDAIQHFISSQGDWDTLGFLGSCASRQVSASGNDMSYSYSLSNLACQDGNKRVGFLVGKRLGADSMRISIARYSVYQKNPAEFSGNILLVRNAMVKYSYTLSLNWEYHPDATDKPGLKGSMDYQRSIAFGPSESSTSDDKTVQGGTGLWIAADGNTYNVRWLNPQTRRNVDRCRQYASGQAAVSSQNHLPLTFDWGGGTCDRSFTITSGNRIETKFLP